MRCSGSPACGPACSAGHLDRHHHHHRGIAGVPGSATEGCDDARVQDVAADAIAAAGGPHGLRLARRHIPRRDGPAARRAGPAHPVRRNAGAVMAAAFLGITPEQSRRWCLLRRPSSRRGDGATVRSAGYCCSPARGSTSGRGQRSRYTPRPKQGWSNWSGRSRSNYPIRCSGECSGSGHRPRRPGQAPTRDPAGIRRAGRHRKPAGRAPDSRADRRSVALLASPAAATMDRAVLLLDTGCSLCTMH
jgi:hypothetical protein